jgi:hypothetical protein
MRHFSGFAHLKAGRQSSLAAKSPKDPVMRSDRYSIPLRPALFPTLLASALFLAGPQSAHAVTWNTGANGGNWINLSSTSSEVGIGTSGTTNPLEKLTIAGGNVLVDNNRYFKGKTIGGSLVNMIGMNSSDLLSLHGGKLTIDVFGGVNVPGAATINGPLSLNGSVSGDVLFTGNVGIGWVSPIRKLYVDGQTTLAGRTNVVGGALVPEGEFLALGPANFANTASFDNSVSMHGLVDIQDLNVVGNLIVWGGKSFGHPHPTDLTKKIVYVAAEAGEALTMARGVSRTENGEATVRLPDHFAMVTSEDAPLTVQLTVEGAPALIYVVSKSRQAIGVKMKASDYSEFQDVTFNYFVQGVRDGFEDHIVVQGINSSGEDPQPSAKRKQYNERAKKTFEHIKSARKRQH